MKDLLKITLTAAVLSTGLFVARAGEEKPVFTDDKQRASYAIGLNVGNSIKRFTYDVDLDMMLKGIKDFLAGEIGLTQEEAQNAINAYQQLAQQQTGQKNRAEGEAFQAANKQKEGVKILPVTLADGTTAELQYSILSEGSGPKPTSNDTVKVHYRGTLVNGNEFDSSYRRGEPVEFPLTRVIRGWTEALQHMPAGSKWQLVIPPNLAYGSQARPGIEPESTLIFEVELLEVQPTPEPSAALPPTPTPPPTTRPAVQPRPPQQVTSDIVGVQGTNIQIIRAQDLLRTNTNAAPR